MQLKYKTKGLAIQVIKEHSGKCAWYNLKVYKSSPFNVIRLKGSFWEHEYSDECMAEPTLVFSAIEDESDKIEIKNVMWTI